MGQPILEGCGDGSSSHASTLPEQAARLVNEVVTGLTAETGPVTADLAHAHAFAAAALQAGVPLQRVLEQLDGLAALLTEAATAELRERPDLAPADAFVAADRLHRGIRALTAAVRDAFDKAGGGSVPDDAGDRFENFTRTIAHELKNPLGAARGAAELLVSGEGTGTPESRTRFAELVLRNVNRALELLDHVRVMTRVAAPASASAPQWESPRSRSTG